MLSSHLVFCLPRLFAPFTVPCRIVFAMPEDLEMWQYHLSFRFFTMVMSHHALPLQSGFCCEPPRSSHGLCRKCSEVSYSISSQGLGSFIRVLLSRSSIKEGGSDKRRISLTLETSEMLLSLHIIFSLERATAVWAILERIWGFDPSLEMIAPRYLSSPLLGCLSSLSSPFCTLWWLFRDGLPGRHLLHLPSFHLQIEGW